MEETITFILAVVVLVFGILQIILFFKLWGMTNDVKRLTNFFINAHKGNTGSIYQEDIKQENRDQYVSDILIEEQSSKGNIIIAGIIIFLIIFTVIVVAYAY